MKNSGLLYTRSMKLGEPGRAARDLADFIHNVAFRGVGNLVVMAPRNLAIQMFNLDHPIDWIKSRHRQRQDWRAENGRPVSYAQEIARLAETAAAAEALLRQRRIEVDAQPAAGDESQRTSQEDATFESQHATEVDSSAFDDDMIQRSLEDLLDSAPLQAINEGVDPDWVRDIIVALTEYNDTDEDSMRRLEAAISAYNDVADRVDAKISEAGAPGAVPLPNEIKAAWDSVRHGS